MFVIDHLVSSHRVKIIMQNYTGGNPTEPVFQYLPGIREWIFQNGTGSKSSIYFAPESIIW